MDSPRSLQALLGETGYWTQTCGELTDGQWYTSGVAP